MENVNQVKSSRNFISDMKLLEMQFDWTLILLNTLFKVQKLRLLIHGKKRCNWGTWPTLVTGNLSFRINYNSLICKKTSLKRFRYRFRRKAENFGKFKALKLGFPPWQKDNRDNVIWCSAKISWKSRRIKRIHLSFTFTSLMLMLRHFTLYDK